jgi:hypothetical protein
VVSIIINGNEQTLETILESMENNICVLLIRESKGAADLLSNIIDKLNELKFEEKKSILNKNDEFYNQFENEIKRGNFNLETIKKIINLYHNEIEENNTILINSVLFENESLETALLKTLTNANSKLFINMKDNNLFFFFFNLK